MKIKQFLFTLIISVLSTALIFSQNTSKPSFGIQGGPNFYNITGKIITGDDLDNSLSLGFHAGINIIFPVAPSIYFQPGLLFSTKGTKISAQVIEDLNFKISYLELPLNLLYREQLGSGKFLLGFGPYLGYAVSGKEKNNLMDIEFKNTVELGESITTVFFKSFDAGANIYAGYETALGIFFQLNTQLGLLKLIRNIKAPSLLNLL